MKTKSTGQRLYALGDMEDDTTYSDLYIFDNCAQFFEATRGYTERAVRIIGFNVQAIRLDGADEHKGDIIRILKRIDGTILESSPPYLPQSKGHAVRFMQVLSLRALFMMTNTGPPESFWAETMHH